MFITTDNKLGREHRQYTSHNRVARLYRPGTQRLLAEYSKRNGCRKWNRTEGMGTITAKMDGKYNTIYYIKYKDLDSRSTWYHISNTIFSETMIISIAYLALSPLANSSFQQTLTKCLPPSSSAICCWALVIIFTECLLFSTNFRFDEISNTLHDLGSVSVSVSVLFVYFHSTQQDRSLWVLSFACLLPYILPYPRLLFYLHCKFNM